MNPLPSQRCIVNLGLYKTGTTTLAKAAESLAMKVHDEFPHSLPSQTLKGMLLEPTKHIDEYVLTNLDRLMTFFIEHDFVSDGWFSLLPLASKHTLRTLKDETDKRGVQLTFVVTLRDLESYLESELHHWVRHNIETKADLSVDERSVLQGLLHTRYHMHLEGIESLSESENITRLELHNQDKWASILSNIDPQCAWDEGIQIAGIQNEAPDLPMEAILLTMRIAHDFDKCLKDVNLLLNSVEADPLCNYMLVLALDDDEFDTLEAKKIMTILEARPRLKHLHLLRNPPRKKNDAPKICQIWALMAEHAWKNGASWVIFLGDDVRIKCSFHYRAIYNYFLKNQMKFNLPSGTYFGCPWFNDIGFRGFPTFPIIGKEHFSIFGSLIPNEHRDLFINQDLDPYLQRMYLKFGAAPQLHDVELTNACGGSDTVPARYNRIPAKNWRDRVLEEICIVPIQSYLQQHNTRATFDMTYEHSLLILDVIVPSYRIDLQYLQDIVSIHVPHYMRTTFIIIIDNPSHLVNMFDPHQKISPSNAALLLERHLEKSSDTKNNIRVRCNNVNLGASSSRNRGIDESAAEYVLFLDDDVIPEKKLLFEYGEELKGYIERKEPILGLLGLVHFPRHRNMSVLHAGVFMSYLLFSFEISGNNIYAEPAWGVTANILFKKFPGMHFDTCYAKTGGGEDVDFALRLGKENGNLKLKCCPSAKVAHLFWSNNILKLCGHFFNWANGDSALFNRFEGPLVYHSYPNLVETWLFLVLPCCLAITNKVLCLSFMTIIMFVVDAAVDMSWNFGTDFNHRLSLLEETKVSTPFAILAHFIANFYVIVLECGRLCGHLKRGHLQHISRRFDWHCGQLEHSKRHFIQREKVKFSLFFATLVACSFKFKA